MTMLNIINADQLVLPSSAEQWLLEINQPTIVEITGKDTLRYRVFSVLIHGNEPSGFFAAFNYLKQLKASQAIPQTNIAICISSIRAAKLEPYFSNRYVPGEFDLNRRFGRSRCRDKVTSLAKDLSNYINSRNPEFVIDLHNTSGQGPAFGVSCYQNPAINKLTSIFSDKMVFTNLVVGSLMEQNFNCPIVTIECGYSYDIKAHEVAFNGMNQLANISTLDDIKESTVTTYSHPLRVQVEPGISIDFGLVKNPNVDITLRKDIELLNYELVRQGTAIGWLNHDLEKSLNAYDQDNKNIICELFCVKNEHIILKKDCHVFMATSILDIALSDCLFYIADTL